MNQYGMNRRQAGSNAKPAVRAQIGRACAQTVRSLRLKAGLSQERLARDLGIDRGNLAGLERGLHTPTFLHDRQAAPGLRRHFCRVLPDVRAHPEPVSTAVKKAAGPSVAAPSGG